MGKLIAIGELLIDFIGVQRAAVSDVQTFEKHPGGAPANVAVCVSRLGGYSEIITKLGTDAFGNYLYDVMKQNGVGTQNILRSNEANTPLAFVSLDDGGERSFSFYRNPSSDLFLNKHEIRPGLFDKGDILHFCSVDLVDYPVRNAHDAAIEYAKAAGAIICFDPNLRYPLWDSKKELHRVANIYIGKADILKVGEDELFALADTDNERAAVDKLFRGCVKLIIVTHGNRGAAAYFLDGDSITCPAFEVRQVDATGAGDAFIGTVLYQLLNDGMDIADTDGLKKNFEKYLYYANKAASIVVTRQGAINALPSHDEVFIKGVLYS